MATLLFLVISIVFIGLGLPDSVFNAAWPAISDNLGLLDTDAVYIFACVALGTVLSSLLASKLVGKFGTALVSAITTVFMAIILIGFSTIDSLLFFCLLSIPLGFGTGLIDSTLTKYATAKYSPSKLTFLHCFYSLGASISPLLMFASLTTSNDWRSGYHLVALVMGIIAVITLITLPFMNKASKQTDENTWNIALSITLQKDPIVFTPGELAKIPAVRTACALFFLTAGVEFTCGLWGSTYLVQSLGLTSTDAAGFLTFYYVGITAGRYFSGRVSVVTPAQKTAQISLAFFGIAFLLFFLPTTSFFNGAALFFIGFGNGPIYPSIISLTPTNFGNNLFGSISTAQNLFYNLGMLTMPLLFGLITTWVGFDAFPIFLFVLYLLLFITTIIYGSRTRLLRLQLKHEEPLF